MTDRDDVLRALSALRPDEPAAIGRNREAVERVMRRVVDDLGEIGAANLLRSVATRIEERGDRLIRGDHNDC